MTNLKTSKGKSSQPAPSKPDASKPFTSNAYRALAAEADELDISKLSFTDQQHHKPKDFASYNAPENSGVSRAATTTNWRKPDPRPPRGFPPAYNPQKEYQGLDPARATVMTRETCVVGKIFRAAVHEPDMSDMPGWGGQMDDSKTCVTHAGAVYSKVRWLIIVAVYENHYMAIPLYTHNGKGLQNKSEEAKREYSSIRDLRLRRGGFENLSMKNVVLDAKMFANTTLLSSKTVAHWTAPLQRKFGLYVEEQGILAPKSAEGITEAWLTKMKPMKAK